MEEFRHIVRQQARLMMHDFDAAVAALPTLLSRADPESIHALADWLQQVLQVPEAPTPDEEASLQQMQGVFERAARAQAKTQDKAQPPAVAEAQREPVATAKPTATSAKNITTA